MDAEILEGEARSAEVPIERFVDALEVYLVFRRPLEAVEERFVRGRSPPGARDIAELLGQEEQRGVIWPSPPAACYVEAIASAMSWTGTQDPGHRRVVEERTAKFVSEFIRNPRVREHLGMVRNLHQASRAEAQKVLGQLKEPVVKPKPKPGSGIEPLALDPWDPLIYPLMNLLMQVRLQVTQVLVRVHVQHLFT